MSNHNLFGHPIVLKTHGCNRPGIPAQPIPPSVNLFVKVTKGCNARCLFCSNADSPAVGIFDTDKLFECINEILDNDIIVNRINITGGEPAVVTPLVNDILERLNQTPFQDIHVHLNTNGLLPQSQILMQHSRWNSISMSLHHYKLQKLSEIYGTSIPETAFRFDGIDMQKVNASCNLIRGYIDSPSEVERMLDFALSLGLPRLGFVSLMKINDYCRQHYVDFSEISLETIPHLYLTQTMDRGLDCKCTNYLYNKDLCILEVYLRNYMNPQLCASSLVFDGQYLRQGFHSDNIIH